MQCTAVQLRRLRLTNHGLASLAGPQTSVFLTPCTVGVSVGALTMARPLRGDHAGRGIQSSSPSIPPPDADRLSHVLRFRLCIRVDAWPAHCPPTARSPPHADERVRTSARLSRKRRCARPAKSQTAFGARSVEKLHDEVIRSVLTDRESPDEGAGVFSASSRAHGHDRSASTLRNLRPTRSIRHGSWRSARPEPRAAPNT